MAEAIKATNETTLKTVEEMTAQRDELLTARFRGVRTAEIDGRRVTYASDTEMAAAITDLERQMASAGEGGRRRRILTCVYRKPKPEHIGDEGHRERGVT